MGRYINSFGRVTHHSEKTISLGTITIDALVRWECGDGDISNPKTLKGGEQVVMLPWAADVVKNHLSKQDPEANRLPLADCADADSLLHSL